MVGRLQDAGAVPSQQEDIAQYRTTGVEATPIVPGKAAMQYMWSNQVVAAWTAAGADRKFKLIAPAAAEGRPGRELSQAVAVHLDHVETRSIPKKRRCSSTS